MHIDIGFNLCFNDSGLGIRDSLFKLFVFNLGLHHGFGIVYIGDTIDFNGRSRGYGIGDVLNLNFILGNSGRVSGH